MTQGLEQQTNEGDINAEGELTSPIRVGSILFRHGKRKLVTSIRNPIIHVLYREEPGITYGHTVLWEKGLVDDRTIWHYRADSYDTFDRACYEAGNRILNEHGITE